MKMRLISTSCQYNNIHRPIASAEFTLGPRDAYLGETLPGQLFFVEPS